MRIPPGTSRSFIAIIGRSGAARSARVPRFIGVGRRAGPPPRQARAPSSAGPLHRPARQDDAPASTSLLPRHPPKVEGWQEVSAATAWGPLPRNKRHDLCNPTSTLKRKRQFPGGARRGTGQESHCGRPSPLFSHNAWNPLPGVTATACEPRGAGHPAPWQVLVTSADGRQAWDLVVPAREWCQCGEKKESIMVNRVLPFVLVALAIALFVSSPALAAEKNSQHGHGRQLRRQETRHEGQGRQGAHPQHH